LIKELIRRGIIKGNSYNPETFKPERWDEGIEFVVCYDTAEFNNALADGDVSALCHDRVQLIKFLNEDRIILQDGFAPQPFGIATQKGSGMSKLTEELISRWLKDGTIKELIYRNHLADLD